MRVLAVAQRLHGVGLQIEGFGFGQIRGDGCIILLRARKSARGQLPAQRSAWAAAILQSRQYWRVVLRVAHHGHAGVVLCSRTQQRHAADIDVFNCGCMRCGRLADGFFERVQIHGDEIDAAPAVRSQLRGIGCCGACQNAGVHGGVQRFDAAAQHLRRAGVIRNFCDAQAGSAQRSRAAAGGQQLPAQRCKAGAKFGEAGLVGNGEQRACHQRGSPPAGWLQQSAQGIHKVGQQPKRSLFRAVIHAGHINFFHGVKGERYAG